ncbi:class F sortase [Natronosporangium hydrolyticum]|uniref:Class F sortase n=1 Tax=Natronosporangium hydrolyticum TaxID=2811111 RepID=A0A895YCV8_9ACTN|nr:class F sortase [Natronosporangium hydrolyticum]QSB15351.1 class F sortase [Natronosporangium hydrolyticum]
MPTTSRAQCAPTRSRRWERILAPSLLGLLLLAGGCAADETAEPGGSQPHVPQQSQHATGDPGAGRAGSALSPAPTRLRIPPLGVESELLHLGVRPDGTAEVPADPALASWYREGGRPEDPLPTVLLGHVDSVDGPGVFGRLPELNDGDRIEVIDEQGIVHAYAVTGIQVHPKDSFPTFEVFGSVGRDALRLVTCTGDFDPDESSYDDNLIVFADRVSPPR